MAATTTSFLPGTASLVEELDSTRAPRTMDENEGGEKKERTARGRAASTLVDGTRPRRAHATRAHAHWPTARRVYCAQRMYCALAKRSARVTCAFGGDESLAVADTTSDRDSVRPRRHSQKSCWWSCATAASSSASCAATTSLVCAVRRGARANGASLTAPSHHSALCITARSQSRTARHHRAHPRRQHVRRHFPRHLSRPRRERRPHGRDCAHPFARARTRGTMWLTCSGRLPALPSPPRALGPGARGFDRLEPGQL